MDTDPPVHASRPPRQPLKHLLPRRWRKRPDPFAHGDHRPLRANAHPEEEAAGSSDSRTALFSGFVMLAAAGLAAWLLAALFG